MLAGPAYDPGSTAFSDNAARFDAASQGDEFMDSSKTRVCSITTMLFLVVAFANNAQATGYKGGVPWQTGDIVVCSGGGTCSVLRVVGGNAILLDQFSDGLVGNNSGVAINNTLHVVSTDDDGGSKAVVYSVASLNPNTSPASPIAHTRAYTFDSSATSTSSKAKAVACRGSRRATRAKPATCRRCSSRPNGHTRSRRVPGARG